MSLRIFASRLISEKDDSGIVFCGLTSAAVQPGRSIINVPVFLFACFGATRSPPGDTFVMTVKDETGPSGFQASPCVSKSVPAHYRR